MGVWLKPATQENICFISKNCAFMIKIIIIKKEIQPGVVSERTGHPQAGRGASSCGKLSCQACRWAATWIEVTSRSPPSIAPFVFRLVVVDPSWLPKKTTTNKKSRGRERENLLTYSSAAVSNKPSAQSRPPCFQLLGLASTSLLCPQNSPRFWWRLFWNEFASNFESTSWDIIKIE